jgi:imidazolonepropionase-like amidohydrolase
MSRYRLVGGAVIDGTGRAPFPATVEWDGDAINAVIEGDAEPAAAGVTVLDVTGHTVMPGLIDAHVHATFDDASSNDELFHHREPAVAALVAGFNVQKMLRAGVTSIMDPDTIFEIGPALRDAVEAGVVVGPRIATGVSALLTSVGGTAGAMIPDDGTAGYARVVNTRDEMVTWTRRHIKRGADWIKIHATGLVPGRGSELDVWTEEEMRVVCDTAHSLGVPVAAHCRSASSTAAAARAGVDLILHASFADEAALDAIVTSGAALCPTFTFLANLVDFGDRVGASPGMQEIFRGELEATAGAVKQAHDAGVAILTGSESGFVLTPYGHWHARELELLVDHVGLTPLEAITCATANGAIAMRRPGEIGTIEAGRAADLLVVDGDPATDVSVLGDRTRLRHVISRGRPVDLSAPWPERGPIPGERVRNWATTPLTRSVAFG